MTRLDAHVHLWDPKRGDYGWLGPHLPKLNRYFSSIELQSLLVAHQVAAVVLVQAAPTAAETDYLLALSAVHEWVRGVVGWVELDSPGAADEVLRRAAQAKLVGLRPMLQDLSEPDWILKSSCAAALEALQETGMTFDALIRPRHLPVIVELAERYPELRIVVDHAAKPVIGRVIDSAWRAGIRELATHTHVTCKVSGLMTELSAPTEAPMIPCYVGELIDAFGSERLIWGSDWPVMTQVTTYSQWLELTERCLAGLTLDARERVFGANAVHCYKLDRS
jgi:L-fuconolactonase